MKSLDSIENTTALDPRPQEWFNEDRTRYIKTVVAAVAPLLRDSGHLRDILIFWIKDDKSSLSSVHSFSIAGNLFLI